MSAKPGSVVRLLLVLLLALSALVQATVVSRTQVNMPLRVDALDYFSYAVNLRQHGVYSMQREWMVDPSIKPVPDAVRVPGYPLLLALLQPRPAWDWLQMLGYLQSVLSVASVALVYLLGKRFLPASWALFAAALTAFCPSLVVMATYVLTETLFTFLMLAALLASAVAAGRPTRWPPALAAGLLWAASALVRPTTLLLPALLLLLVLLLPRLAAWRRSAAIGLLAFALAMLPWTLRNQSLPPSAPGNNLTVKSVAHGSYPDFMYDGRRESFGYPYRHDPGADARSRDWAGLGQALAADFRAHPWRMARWYLVGKPLAFLSWADPQSWDIFIYAVNKSPYFDNPWLNRSWQLMSMLHAPLVALALVALLAAFLRPRALAMAEGASLPAAVLVALVLAYGIAMHMLVAPFPRYNVPFRPLIFLLAALALHASYRLVRRRFAAPPLAEVAHGV